MIPTTNDILSQIHRISENIGRTPLRPISGLHHNDKVQIFAKVEWEQLSGSVKARAAFRIIRQAVIDGRWTENKILLDATSGNTGIAYATIGKKLGLKVALVLPENATRERKEILQSLDAEIIYSSRFGGTDEAQQKAKELALQHPEKYFYADQYGNADNWKAHYFGTAEELINQVSGITHFVAGLGTTGTFVGTSKRLKEYNPHLRAVALQPDLALHGLEGWKHLETAAIPKIFAPDIADSHIQISTETAYEIIKNYRLEGVLLSPSSAANIAGAIEVARQIDQGIIVTVLPDNAEKYSHIINQIL